MEARFVPLFADAKRLWSAPNLASGSGKQDRNSARCSGLLLIPDGSRKPTGRTNLWAFSACFSAPMTLAYLELLRTLILGIDPERTWIFWILFSAWWLLHTVELAKTGSLRNAELETCLFKSFNQL